MDGHRFDQITKTMAGTGSRRTFVKGLAGLTAGLAALRYRATSAACRPGGWYCQRNTDCCSGACNVDSRGGRRRICCEADPIEATCGDYCGYAINNCGVEIYCGCEGGECCGEVCVDLSSDPFNCGDCGVVCGATQVCSNYSCLSGPGDPCTSSDECVAYCTCGTNAQAGVCNADYYQDFSVDTYDWSGVALNAGSAIVATDGSSFSRLGGYTAEFHPNGWVASVDIYLDMTFNTVLGTDIRLDYSVAANRPDCAHRRDFIFHVGTDPTDVGYFAISVSNTSPGWPSNPGRAPAFVSESGWYQLQHTFADAGDGTLGCNLDLTGPSGYVGGWYLKDATDIIGSTVGGHRYAWFVTNGFSGLEMDNSRRYYL